MAGSTELFNMQNSRATGKPGARRHLSGVSKLYRSTYAVREPARRLMPHTFRNVERPKGALGVRKLASALDRDAGHFGKSYIFK